MARTLKSDKLLFWVTLLLVGISVVMVYSASAVSAAADFENSSYYLVKQLVWVSAGLAILVGVMRVDYHVFARPHVIVALLGVTVVALIVVFLFEPRANTHRWLSVGGISVQPSEVAKLVAIFFASALLARRMHQLGDPRQVLAPIAVVTLALAGLIVSQPDFGTAAVLVLVVLTILFSAGLHYRYLAGIAVLLVPAAFAIAWMSPYKWRRLMSFLDPAADPLGDGYQVLQSLTALGSGGIFGRGLMAGVQKIYYVPEAHTDFIFAIVGEEFGLLGTTLVLVCFGIIAWRGVRASLLAPDRFGAFLAIGLTMMVAAQAFINISVTLSLVPTKGIPLPFVSNGGSSLLVNLMAMGILLNISQQASPTAAAAVGGRG
jgi:cell division protein FtsW